MPNDPATIALDLRRLKPWIPAIVAGCAPWGENPYLLAAMCLRESDAGCGVGYHPQGAADGWGDQGHAMGLWQIDIRWHRTFVLSADGHDPAKQCGYACRILHENREDLQHSQSLPPDDLERATVSAYNAGVGAVIHALVMGRDPDAITTGGDYSRWVFDKLNALQLAAPALFTPALEAV